MSSDFVRQNSFLRLSGMFFFAVLLALAMGGCARTKSFSSSDIVTPNMGSSRVLIMPLDVELSVLTAGGLLETNAEWSEKGLAHLTRAIEFNKKAIGVEFLNFTDFEDVLTLEDRGAVSELERLHGLVGQAIQIHKYDGPFLATKTNQFDWSLGPSGKSLAEKTGADYALFIYARQSFANSSRKALQALALVLASYYIPGGTEQGFFTLVDLRTGNVVWYNALALGKANLREQAGADTFASWMFHSFPVAR